MPAAGGVKSGKSVGNGYVGTAVAEPKRAAGSCSLLNVSGGLKIPPGRE